MKNHISREKLLELVSIHTHLLSTFSVPDSVPGSGDTDKAPVLREVSLATPVGLFPSCWEGGCPGRCPLKRRQESSGAAREEAPGRDREAGSLCGA